MKAVKRWRYYCDFCRKVSGTRQAMEGHESSCTMNPGRQCKMCVAITGNNGTPLPEMLELLPDPAKYMIHHPEMVIEDDMPWGLGPDTIPGYDSPDDEALRAATHAALPALRELTEDCPACILAALRQRGIPVPIVTDFNFTTEFKDARVRMSESRREQNQYGGW